MEISQLSLVGLEEGMTHKINPLLLNYKINFYIFKNICYKKYCAILCVVKKSNLLTKKYLITLTILVVSTRYILLVNDSIILINQKKN